MNQYVYVISHIYLFRVYMFLNIFSLVQRKDILQMHLKQFNLFEISAAYMNWRGGYCMRRQLYKKQLPF